MVRALESGGRFVEEKCDMTELVCYCFGYSAADIREDVIANNGRSSVLEKITVEKQAGNCQCATLHPQGR